MKFSSQRYRIRIPTQRLVVMVIIIVLSMLVQFNERLTLTSPKDTVITNNVRTPSTTPSIVETGTATMTVDLVSKAIAQYGSPQFYPVVKVVDGDTLKLNVDGTVETIRLIGIDTPESVHPTEPVECMGVEAATEAKRLLLGQSVRFVTDEAQDTHDRYGRLLGYVFLSNGDNLAELLLRTGYATEYTYDGVYQYQDAFRAAEQVARTAAVGLWAERACTEAVTNPLVNN